MSFGDSLSDIGTYAPATSLAGAAGTPPYFGGKFTTNETSTGAPDANPLGKVWVENLAGSLGLIVTPAQVGFGASSVMCPAAAVPALATTCTAYGQGGSRVTDPNGIGHSTGALTVPMVTQIALNLGFILGGAITVEALFSWPGIGLATIDAIQAKDYPMLQGLYLVTSALVIVCNLAADLLYGRLDPRVRNT